MRLRLLVLLVGLASTHFLGAQEKEIMGRMQALDKVNGTITLVPIGQKTPMKLSLLSDGLPVTDPAGSKLNFDDLRPDFRVAVRLVDDDVKAIRLDQHCTWGVIAKTDAADHAIHARRYGHIVKIKLHPETKIFQDGQPATLPQLRAGGSYQAVYDADHKVIQVLRTGKGVMSSSPYARNVNATGILLDVDEAKKSFRVITWGDRVEDLDLRYDDAWTSVRLLHSSYALREVPPSTLRARMKVTFYYDADTRLVNNMDAFAPTYTRKTVTAVDRAKRQVSFLDDDKTVTLTIAADAKIINNLGPGKIDDVKEKRILNICTSPDGKEAIFINVFAR